MAYWILQANPKSYRIFDALRDAAAIRTWTVARHRKDITTGDEFALWASGPKSGVYAFGVVTGSAEFTPDDPDPYWTEPVDATEPVWHVGIKVTDVLEYPIPRREIAADPALADSAIIKMAGGGNPFPLDDLQWRAILAHQPGTPGLKARAAVAAPRSAGTGQLAWTREETILAMDFYVTYGAIRGGPIPGQHTAEIARLSMLLKTLSAYPPEVQGEKYRNTHGVYLKLMNLRAVQTGGAHGMNRISQTDQAVWRDYIDDLGILHAEATAIRQRLAEGVLTPAGTAAPIVEDVPIEARHTERFMCSPSGEPREAERAEAALVNDYQAHLAAEGVAVSRKKYRTGQVRPLFCDLWVQDWRALIEAKNSDSRERLRMAIGQLYDYRRFHDEPHVRLAVLLPHKPSPDGLALLQSAGIEAIWRYGEGFRDSANGAFA